MACLLRHSCWVNLQMQLFLDVETLSVLRVTPFSGGNPVDVIVLPRWGPPVASPPRAYDTAATQLYPASGRLIPYNSNSPTGSTFTAFSTFVSPRGLIKICPGFASSHSREA